MVGISIGAGIYSTPQIIAGYLGSFSVIAFLWLAVGIFALAGGFVYAELGTRLPETGGEYVYLSRTFGPFAGFMFGWSQLFIIRTSTAAGLALIAADYLGYFVRLSGPARTLVAFGVLAVLGVFNWIGVQRASAFQKVATSLKVSGLLLLVVLGLFLTQAQNNRLAAGSSLPASAVPLGNLAAALMMIVFTYTGWDRVGYVAGEMKNPNRVVPVSLFVGMGIVIVVYNLTNYIYHRTLGLAGVEQSTIVASDTATRLMGPVGAGFVAVLVMLSTTSSINGTMMTASRAYYAMARDGLFFQLVGLHPPQVPDTRAGHPRPLPLGGGDHLDPEKVRDNCRRHGLCRSDLLFTGDDSALQAEAAAGRGGAGLSSSFISNPSRSLSGRLGRPAPLPRLFRMAAIGGRPSIHCDRLTVFGLLATEKKGRGLTPRNPKKERRSALSNEGPRALWIEPLTRFFR